MRPTLGVSLLALSAAAGLTVPQVQAQPSRDKLIFVIPQAVDARPQSGIGVKSVDPIRGSADFESVAGSNESFARIGGGLMRPFHIGIATQLSSIPIASPASGVIFKEDPATGVALPSSDSLGPILTERAETIGKGKFFFGYTRQQFDFSQIEGQSLTNLRALDRGGVPTKVLQDGVPQVTSPTTIDTTIDLKLDQNIAVFTYGITGRIDVTGALTWMHASAAATAANGQIYNSGNPFAEGTCWCAQTFDVNASRNSFNRDFGRSGFRVDGVFGSVRRSSNGIGDTLLRVKGNVFEGRSLSLALGTELRLPTGDAENYHGSGALAVKPFAAISLRTRTAGFVRVSPHFNVGYQWNGNSVLAGDVNTGTKGKLPHMLPWSAGAGVSLGRRVTVLTDILGMALVDSYRLRYETVPGRGRDVAPASGLTLAPDKQTFHQTSGAFGLKLKLAGNMVFSTNFLVALDNNGLRDKVVPLFGLGYSF